MAKKKWIVEFEVFSYVTNKKKGNKKIKRMFKQVEPILCSKTDPKHKCKNGWIIGSRVMTEEMWEKREDRLYGNRS